MNISIIITIFKYNTFYNDAFIVLKIKNVSIPPEGKGFILYN